MSEISLATKPHLDSCLEIRAAAFTDQAPSCYTDEQVEDLLSRDESRGMLEMMSLSQMFVATSQGSIVGCAGWRETNIYNLYVHPSFMRQGIGTALLSSIETQFLQKHHLMRSTSTLVSTRDPFTKATATLCCEKSYRTTALPI